MTSSNVHKQQSPSGEDLINRSCSDIGLGSNVIDESLAQIQILSLIILENPVSRRMLLLN